MICTYPDRRNEWKKNGLIYFEKLNTNKYFSANESFSFKINLMKKIFLFTITAGMFVAADTRASVVVSDSKPATDSAVTRELKFDDVAVTDALREFKSLSRVDRKARVFEVKKMLKEYKAEKKAGSEPSTNTVLLAILAILLPPLAVYLHEGTINGKFWLSLLLTLLFWIPGVIYALIVVLG